MGRPLQSIETMEFIDEPLSFRRKLAIGTVGLIGLLGFAAHARADVTLRELIEAEAATHVRAGVQGELMDDGFEIVNLDVFYDPAVNPVALQADVHIDEGCDIGVNGFADVQVGQVVDTFDYSVPGADSTFDTAEQVRESVRASGVCD